MKVIGVFGKKGGSGKTLVAHYIAHGMSKGLKVETMVMQTDVRTVRPDEFVSGREYGMSSIPNENPEKDFEYILKLYEKASQLPNLCLIIDGGANRTALDKKLAPLCDLVLIPFGYGKEDMDVAEADLWALKLEAKNAQKRQIEQGFDPAIDTKVMLLQNRWPGTQSKFQSITNRPSVRDFLFKAEEQNMLFPKYIPDMPSLTEMANSNDPRHTPRIDGQTRSFARYVAAFLGMTTQNGEYVEADETFDDQEDDDVSSASEVRASGNNRDAA
jgi:cellulose biosynthesis protein BcsQ